MHVHFYNMAINVEEVTPSRTSDTEATKSYEILNLNQVTEAKECISQAYHMYSSCTSYESIKQKVTTSLPTNYISTTPLQLRYKSVNSVTSLQFLVFQEVNHCEWQLKDLKLQEIGTAGLQTYHWAT